MWGQVKRHKGRMGGSEHTKDREIHGEDEETWTRLSTRSEIWVDAQGQGGRGEEWQDFCL